MPQTCCSLSHKLTLDWWQVWVCIQHWAATSRGHVAVPITVLCFVAGVRHLGESVQHQSAVVAVWRCSLEGSGCRPDPSKPDLCTLPGEHHHVCTACCFIFDFLFSSHVRPHKQTSATQQQPLESAPALAIALFFTLPTKYISPPTQQQPRSTAYLIVT